MEDRRGTEYYAWLIRGQDASFGAVGGVELPAKCFQPAVCFTSLAPRGVGYFPSAGPSFWPQVVFRNKNA